MLILNNGVPKSGSSWVQKITAEMIKPAYPSQEWRNSWSNPSVDNDKLAAFFESGEWRKAPTLLKMHFVNTPEMSFLTGPDVRILVSYRNIPDSVLSWFYMSVRRGTTTLEQKDAWMKKEGLLFAEDLLRHRNSWFKHPNVQMLKYEDMLLEGPQHVIRIAEFLGHSILDARISEILEKTQVKLPEGAQPRDDQHVRTGGRSLAKEELQADVFEQLTELEHSKALLL